MICSLMCIFKITLSEERLKVVPGWLLFKMGIHCFKIPNASSFICATVATSHYSQFFLHILTFSLFILFVQLVVFSLLSVYSNLFPLSLYGFPSYFWLNSIIYIFFTYYTITYVIFLYNEKSTF